MPSERLVEIPPSELRDGDQVYLDNRWRLVMEEPVPLTPATDGVPRVEAVVSGDSPVGGFRRLFRCDVIVKRMSDTGLTFAEARALRRREFGGGMLSFDTAYHDALRAGRTPAEAQKLGVEATLDQIASYMGA